MTRSDLAVVITTGMAFSFLVFVVWVKSKAEQEV